MRIPGGRTFQVEGPASATSAKALRQGRAWRVQERARRPVWLEGSKMGGGLEGSDKRPVWSTESLAGVVRTLASTPSDLGRKGDILSRAGPWSHLSGCWVESTTGRAERRLLLSGRWWMMGAGSGGGEKQSDSGHSLRVQPIGFADGPEGGQQEK